MEFYCFCCFYEYVYCSCSVQIWTHEWNRMNEMDFRDVRICPHCESLLLPLASCDYSFGTQNYNKIKSVENVQRSTLAHLHKLCCVVYFTHFFFFHFSHFVCCYVYLWMNKCATTELQRRTSNCEFHKIVLQAHNNGKTSPLPYTFYYTRPYDFINGKQFVYAVRAASRQDTRTHIVPGPLHTIFHSSIDIVVIVAHHLHI